MNEVVREPGFSVVRVFISCVDRLFGFLSVEKSAILGSLEGPERGSWRSVVGLDPISSPPDPQNVALCFLSLSLCGSSR